MILGKNKILFFIFLFFSAHLLGQQVGHNTYVKNGSRLTSKCKYSKAAVIWDSDPDCEACKKEGQQRLDDIKANNERLEREGIEKVFNEDVKAAQKYEAEGDLIMAIAMYEHSTKYKPNDSFVKNKIAQLKKKKEDKDKKNQPSTVVFDDHSNTSNNTQSNSSQTNNGNSASSSQTKKNDSFWDDEKKDNSSNTNGQKNTPDDAYNSKMDEGKKAAANSDYGAAAKSFRETNKLKPNAQTQQDAEIMEQLDRNQKTGTTIDRDKLIKDQQMDSFDGTANGSLQTLAKGTGAALATGHLNAGVIAGGVGVAASWLQSNNAENEREQAAKAAEEEARVERERQANIRESNRKFLILQQKQQNVNNATNYFPKSKYGTENMPNSIHNLFFMFYGINDFSDEYTQATVFLSTPFCISRYDEDGTWPFVSDFKRKMLEQINLVDKSVKKVELLGFYADKETAENTYLDYYKNCLINDLKINTVEGIKMSDKKMNDSKTNKPKSTNNEDNNFWEK